MINSKIVLALLATTTMLSSKANACEMREMMFFGNVRNVQQHSVPGAMVCTFQVSISKYWMSSVCPLAPGEATNLEFADPSCTKREGQAIDGRIFNDGSEHGIQQ